MALTSGSPDIIDDAFAPAILSDVSPLEGRELRLLTRLRAALADLAAREGFCGAVYIHVGHGLRGASESSQRIEPRRLIATARFDEDKYLRRNYLVHDPVVRRAVDSLTPFVWRRDEMANTTPEALRVLGALQGWGMDAGFVAPVQDYALGPAFLNLAFDGDAPPSAALGEGGRLLMAAIRLHAAAQALARHNDPCSETTLNPREMAVLRLAAIGRTEQETAQSLELSRRGVQFHLHRAIAKLGAVNKTAAVAKAVQAGLIAP